MISHNFAQQQGSSDVAYPFRLSVVNHSGLACALCPWNKFCIGCPLTDALLNIDRHLVLGIDWNVQVLKMYFNNDAANRFETHVSVKENRELQDYPVSLGECLELFGREEQLEEFYCRKCKEHRSATKCLSLYRLPPLMCIHLKRFQEHRGRWEKTNKIVQFPLKELRFQGSQESFSL
jgi:ubiquitin carboxyl-terminal hydrolase 6/32